MPLHPNYYTDKRPLYKRMLSKIPFGWLFMLLLVVFAGFGLWAESKYTYCIKQGKQNYYTNSYRQTGGCIMFPDGSRGDSTQICGAYTLIKQH